MLSLNLGQQPSVRRSGDYSEGKTAAETKVRLGRVLEPVHLAIVHLRFFRVYLHILFAGRVVEDEALKWKAGSPPKINDLMPPIMRSAGRSTGGMFSALYTLPTMSGLSGSPSSNTTTTSWPMRGQKNAPQ